ncbi:type II toxin-antitoxin system HigB family toxin [Dryocola sp. BD626]|jgi:mRNA interferase HigB|uniref:type II toxin-antitoxin system HigB family toxin n=1 Tax=Dryocola sp. BD626 TaxID=3133273 RepID=UPI003F50B70F
MHVISKEPFLAASLKYSNISVALLATYKQLSEKDFISPADLKNQFPSLDNFKYRDKWWVIDVGGNSLRIIAYINFINKKVFVKHIVTHAEYDKLSRYYRENRE